MVRASFQPRRRQSKRDPKTDDSHEIDPTPTITEVGQVPTCLIMDLMDVETKRKCKFVGIGFDKVGKVGLWRGVAESVVCAF